MKHHGKGGFTGPSGKRVRGTFHGSGAASVKVGPIRSPYKDKILGK